MKKLIGFVRLFYTRFIEYYYVKWQFKIARDKAKRMHNVTGKRYWVIRLQGRYYVMSNDDIKLAKARKVFQKDIDHIKLHQVSAYRTN